VTSVHRFTDGEIRLRTGLVPIGAVLFATFATSSHIPVWIATPDAQACGPCPVIHRRSLRAALASGVSWLLGR